MYVVDDGALSAAVTRKTLVARVVAEGRDPGATALGDLAEPPYYTIDADTPLDEAFRLHRGTRCGAGPGRRRRATRRRRPCKAVRAPLAEDEDPPEPDEA